MQKYLVLSDIDGTLCPNPPIMFTMAEQAKTSSQQPGYLQKMRQHLKNYQNGSLGYEDFAQQLLIMYANRMKGAEYTAVVQEVRDLFDQGKLTFFPEVYKLLTELQKTHDLYFVTASPQFIAAVICDSFPGSSFISTNFEVENGVFSGQVKHSLATKEAKKSAIRNLVKQYPHNNSFAFGDTINDLPMFESVEKAICVNPEEELIKAIAGKGYQILTTEKN